MRRSGCRIMPICRGKSHGLTPLGCCTQHVYAIPGCLGYRMGLRFRRSWSLVPGIRVNLGLRSGSVSFGPRGLHYTVGTSGSRVTAGLPGTGLFWTQKLSSPWTPPGAGKFNQPKSHLAPNPVAQPAQTYSPQIFSPPIAHPVQPAQLVQPQITSPWLGSGSQSLPPPHKHVFVPLWLFGTALTVMAIAVLCLAAATIGKVLH